LKTVEGLEESCLVLPLSNKLPPFPLTLPSKAEKHFILFFYFFILPSQHRQQLEWLTMDRRTALSHSHSSPPLPLKRGKKMPNANQTHTPYHTPHPSPHPIPTASLQILIKISIHPPTHLHRQAFPPSLPLSLGHSLNSTTHTHHPIHNTSLFPLLLLYILP